MQANDFESQYSKTGTYFNGSYGTGKGVDETGGRANTDDQTSYIKNNAKP
jgi:hypothetical protein